MYLEVRSRTAQKSLFSIVLFYEDATPKKPSFSENMGPGSKTSKKKPGF
jgi:hypothetical protein